MCKSFVDYGYTKCITFFETLSDAENWCGTCQDNSAIYEITYGIHYDSLTNPGPPIKVCKKKS